MAFKMSSYNSQGAKGHFQSGKMKVLSMKKKRTGGSGSSGG